MPNLSIPEAVAENSSISSAAKLAYAETFARLKKGERPHMHISDIGLAIALGGDDLITALRSLEDNGYARIDETIGKLDDLVPDQDVRLTAVIVVEVVHRIAMDTVSIFNRRFKAPNEAYWDERQIGRTVYRASSAK